MKPFLKPTNNPVLLISLLILTFAAATPGALFGPKGDSAEEKRQTVRKQRDEMLTDSKLNK